MSSLTERLAKVQEGLKVPKGQMNKFGGYAYRSCEDILEAVKPHLKGLVLTVSDEVQLIGARVYVTATVNITDGVESVSTSASAREPEAQKGMNEAQITGSASSYARKYALNGLFLIDDTKDADATNDHGKSKPKSPVKKAAAKNTAPAVAQAASGNSFRKSVKPAAPAAQEEDEL